MSSFKSERLKEPMAILTTSVICVETDARAEELASSMALAWVQLRTGRSGPLPSPEEARAYRYTAAEPEGIEVSAVPLYPPIDGNTIPALYLEHMIDCIILFPLVLHP